ncbi:MAG: helix-turn-helix transcriptional regulator [Chloroflexota bacterium]|nr:helix-turn-helix transcriptional regulator [Chloroflexota bacterium]
MSERDRFIVERIAAGDRNREIAAELHVCEQTVKWHVSKLLCVFAVRNRAALVIAIAARQISTLPQGDSSSRKVQAGAVARKGASRSG